MGCSGEMKLLESLIACLADKSYQVLESELQEIFESC